MTQQPKQWQFSDNGGEVEVVLINKDACVSQP